MKREQEALRIPEPCRAHRAAIERFVTGTLEEVHHPALEAHLRRCAGCRGYRDWIHAHDRAAGGLLAAARKRRIDPEEVRRRLEGHLGRLAAGEAAAALTLIATQGFLRRNDPDPTILCYARSLRPATLRAKGQGALAEIRRVPWASAWEGGRLTTALEEILPESERIEDGRTLATQACRLALEIDPLCYRAAQIQIRLIREDGYKDNDTFERNVELLLASDQKVLQADGYGERGAFVSLENDELEEAARLYQHAALTNPSYALNPFNEWYLSLLLEDTHRSRDSYRRFQSMMKSARHIPARRRQWFDLCTNILMAGFSDGFLTRTKLGGCLRRLRTTLQEE